MYGVAGPKPPVAKYGQPIVPNLAVRHLCPNCQVDPPNIVEEYSHGDLVCADCGTILGDRIVDTRSEWRTFAGDEGGDDPSRVGGPSNPLLANQALETSISARDGRTGMSRDLQRAQNRANQQNAGPGKGSNPVQLQAAFARISETCDAMQLPRSLAERAQHAYVVGDRERVSRGKNDDALIAACIILACRVAHADRSFREVCKITKVSKSDLGRVFSVLRVAVRDAGLFGSSIPGGALSSSNNSAEGLLGRFCNYLDLGNAVFNASKYIATTAVAKSDIDGRSPLSIAAGVLYFTIILFEKSTTSKEVADIAGVSESTIKLICKKVAEEMDVVVKPEWKTQFPNGYATLVALGKPSGASKASRSGTPATNGKDKKGSTPTPETKDDKDKDGKDGKKDKKEKDGKKDKEKDKDANGKA